VKASRHGPKGWIRVIMGLGSSQVDRIEELSWVGADRRIKSSWLGLKVQPSWSKLILSGNSRWVGPS